MVIYASGSRSLATLEMIVRRSAIIPLLKYKMMVIFLTEEASSIRQIRINDLPDNWRTMAGMMALQDIGAIWYDSRESLVLKVPSVVVPQEFNYVINAKHPLFSKNVRLVRVEEYFWDGVIFDSGYSIGVLVTDGVL